MVVQVDSMAISFDRLFVVLVCRSIGSIEPQVFNEEIHEEEIGYNTPGEESVQGGIFIFILTCNIFNYHYCYYYYVTITKFCME